MRLWLSMIVLNASVQADTTSYVEYTCDKAGNIVANKFTLSVDRIRLNGAHSPRFHQILLVTRKCALRSLFIHKLILRQYNFDGVLALRRLESISYGKACI